MIYIYIYIYIYTHICIYVLQEVGALPLRRARSAELLHWLLQRLDLLLYPGTHVMVFQLLLNKNTSEMYGCLA